MISWVSKAPVHFFLIFPVVVNFLVTWNFFEGYFTVYFAKQWALATKQVSIIHLLALPFCKKNICHWLMGEILLLWTIKQLDNVLVFGKSLSWIYKICGGYLRTFCCCELSKLWVNNKYYSSSLQNKNGHLSCQCPTYGPFIKEYFVYA